MNVDEIAKIIKALRMTSFEHVDSDALTSIRARIKNLPSHEQIVTLAENDGYLSSVEKELGEILRLIEVYGRRDKESEIRYKTKTGLPPRFKVMEPKDMNKSEFVKGLVSLSETADSKGMTKVSSDLLVFAKRAKTEEVKMAELEKYMHDSGFSKEAGPMWDKVKGMFGKDDYGKAVTQQKQNVKQQQRIDQATYNALSQIQQGKITDSDHAKQLIGQITNEVAKKEVADFAGKIEQIENQYAAEVQNLQAKATQLLQSWSATSGFQASQPAASQPAAATAGGIPSDWKAVEGSTSLYDLPNGMRVQLVNK